VIDEKMYPEAAEAMRVATHVVMMPSGLRRWADMHWILTQASRSMCDDWQAEATCEGLRLLAKGLTGERLYRGVSLHMRLTIRNDTKAGAIPHDADATTPSAEAFYFDKDARSAEWYDHLASCLTERQWDMVNAYASTGSPTEAAKMVGSTKSNVLRAVRRAREILEGAPTFSSEIVQGKEGG